MNRLANVKQALGKRLFTIPKEAAVKRWLRRGLAYGVTSLAACAVLACAIGNYLGTRSLRRELVAARAANIPEALGLADERPVPPQDKDATRYYQAAFALIRERTSPGLRALPIVGKAKLPPLGVTLSPESLEAIEHHLEANAEALTHLQKAVKLAQCRFPIEWNGWGTLLGHLTKLRAGARLLVLEALAAASRGKWDEAVQSCRDAFRIPRAIGREPCLVSQLVRIAVGHLSLRVGLERVLAWGSVPEAMLHALGTDISSEDRDFGMLSAWRGEAASQIELISQIREGDLQCEEFCRLVCGEPQPATWWSNPLVFWVLDACGVLEFSAAKCVGMVSEVVELQNLPPQQRWEAAQKWGQRLRKLNRGFHFLPRTLLPLAHLATRQELEYRALLRCAGTALAAEVYRQQNGSFPVRLSDIPRADGSPPMADPFTQEPLRMARTREGVVIYSVGGDGNDDGGSVERGSRTARPKDIGFRLLDPECRGRTVRMPANKTADDEGSPAVPVGR